MRFSLYVIVMVILAFTSGLINQDPSQWISWIHGTMFGVFMMVLKHA